MSESQRHPIPNRPRRRRPPPGHASPPAPPASLATAVLGACMATGTTATTTTTAGDRRRRRRPRRRSRPHVDVDDLDLDRHVVELDRLDRLDEQHVDRGHLVERELTMDAHVDRFAAMGTTVEVTVVGGTPSLLTIARGRIRDLELRWSRFLPDSEVSRLNARRRRADAGLARDGHAAHGRA